MELTTLKQRKSAGANKKLTKSYQRVAGLLTALRQKNLDEAYLARLNEEIARFNSFSGEDKALAKMMNTFYGRTLERLPKETGYVPKGHYRTLGMSLGMAAIGLPLGVIAAFALDNLAFIALGLPIGMGVGMLLGIRKDEQARKEGKQIDLEI